MDLFTNHYNLKAAAKRIRSMIPNADSPVIVCDPSLLGAIDTARKAYARDNRSNNPELAYRSALGTRKCTYADYIIYRVLEYRPSPNTPIRAGRHSELWERMHKLNGPEERIEEVEEFSGGIIPLENLLFYSPTSFEGVVDGIADIYDKPPFNQMWFVFRLRSQTEPEPSVEEASDADLNAVPEPIQVSQLDDDQDMDAMPIDDVEDQYMEDFAEDDYSMSDSGSFDGLEMPRKVRRRESGSSSDSAADMPTPGSINNTNVGSDPAEVLTGGDCEAKFHLGAFAHIFFYYLRFLLSQPLVEIATLNDEHASKVKTALAHLHRFCATVLLTFESRGMSVHMKNAVRQRMSTGNIKPVDLGQIKSLVRDFIRGSVSEEMPADIQEKMKEHITHETWMYIIQEWIIAAKYIIESVDTLVETAVEASKQEQMDPQINDLTKSVEGMYGPHAWDPTQE